MDTWIKPVGFTLFPHIGAFAGAIITKKNIKNWYEKVVILFSVFII